MTVQSGRFDDLLTRVVSAAVLVAIFLIGIWIGGSVFLALVAVVVGLMVWELARMLSPDSARLAVALGVSAAIAVVLARLLPAGPGLPVLALPALLGFVSFRENRRLFALYTALISLAGLGLHILRADFGLVWMVWLAAIVVATDVLGYFAGRLIGGPKFWPRVSPKKTWSGTVAGWIGAGVVALLFAAYTDAVFEMIAISIILSLASQMGDLGESAIKRKAGVKDSSALIPGHGGLLDRFDGMLGASVALLVIEQIVSFPPVAM